jgi:hypothetical protein
VAVADDGATLAALDQNGVVSLWHSGQVSGPESDDRPPTAGLDVPGARLHSNLAWALATSPDPSFRKHERAAALAALAVELGPRDGINWRVLGVARYRLGQWKEAALALERGMELCAGGDPIDWIFFAMALHQGGEFIRARRWFDRVVDQMDANRLRADRRNRPDHEDLTGFRAEAARLLGAPSGPKRPGQATR